MGVDSLTDWTLLFTGAPDELRVNASLNFNRPAGIASVLGIVRLQQVLTADRQFQLRREVPAESRVHRLVASNRLSGQGADVAICLDKIHFLWQIHERL